MNDAKIRDYNKEANRGASLRHNEFSDWSIDERKSILKYKTRESITTEIGESILSLRPIEKSETAKSFDQQRVEPLKAHRLSSLNAQVNRFSATYGGK